MPTLGFIISLPYIRWCYDRKSEYWWEEWYGIQQWIQSISCCGMLFRESNANSCFATYYSVFLPISTVELLRMRTLVICADLTVSKGYHFVAQTATQIICLIYCRTKCIMMFGRLSVKMLCCSVWASLLCYLANVVGGRWADSKPIWGGTVVSARSLHFERQCYAAASIVLRSLL